MVLKYTLNAMAFYRIIIKFYLIKYNYFYASENRRLRLIYKSIVIERKKSNCYKHKK